MFYMIKNRIDLEFHINYSDLLYNTNYLYGSIFHKCIETEEYAMYKDEKYIYLLNEDFNVIEKKKIVDNAWVDLIYYNNNKFIFKYQDNTNIYYTNLDKVTISIPLDKKMEEYLILNDKLYIFNIDNFNCYVYDNSLEKLNENIDKESVTNKFRERYKFIDNELLNLKNDFLIHSFKFEDSFITITTKYNNNSIYINKLDLNYNLIMTKELCNSKTYDFKVQQFENNYFISYLLPRNRIVIKKFDSKLNLLNEENIASYRNDFIILNNNLCLIIDDHKRYDKDMKQYKNQELMGNSSIIILK